MRVGAPDATLTGHAGVLAVSELVARLGLVQTLDDYVGAIKQRDRGLSAGEFLVGLAQAHMLGIGFWSGLDRLPADSVAQSLSGVAMPASTTALALAARFDAGKRSGIEDAIAEVTHRFVRLLPAPRRQVLRTRRPTIDFDATEVETYGRRKDGIAYNYKGQRAGRPHVATWAEAGVVLSADLLAGDEDPRPGTVDLLRRAIAGLRAAGITRRPKARGDAGYFSATIAHGLLELDCDFAIGVRRNRAVWRLLDGISESDWTQAIDMPGAQVAVAKYQPKDWPEKIACVIRRVKLSAEQISADPRARRRRTIPEGQLTLALGGNCEHVYGYSFIITNLDVSTPGKAAQVEHWHRHRTDIEDRIRDAKHGAALRHLPSGNRDANTIWMWGALLAVNLSAWLQDLGQLDHGDGQGRAHLGNLRHRLLHVPARLVCHARTLTLRPAPGYGILAEVIARLRRLPPPA